MVSTQLCVGPGLRERVRIPLYFTRFTLDLLVLSSMLYPCSTLPSWSVEPPQVQFFQRLNFSSPIGEGKVVTICVDQKVETSESKHSVDYLSTNHSVVTSASTPQLL